MVVKDGWYSRLQQVLDTCSSEFPGVIRRGAAQNVGLGLALNEGLKACKGDLSPVWIRRHIPARPMRKQLAMFEAT